MYRRRRLRHTVAYTRLSEDVPWIVGVIAQLAMQVSHRGAQQLDIAGVRCSPDPLQDLAMGQFAANRKWVLLIERIGVWMLWIGGVFACAVSIGLFISLIVRPTASINAANLATLILGFTGGLIAVRCSNRPRWLLASNVLLLLAVIPTIFGWLWMVYIGPTMLLAVGTSLKLLEMNRK